MILNTSCLLLVLDKVTWNISRVLVNIYRVMIILHKISLNISRRTDSFRVR